MPVHRTNKKSAQILVGVKKSRHHHQSVHQPKFQSLIADFFIPIYKKVIGKSPFFIQTPSSQKFLIVVGNKLLPSMGYCDVHEASIDLRNTFHNENRYICEISPHILYQYVLAVMWFFFIASCLIATTGRSQVYTFFHIPYPL